MTKCICTYVFCTGARHEGPSLLNNLYPLQYGIYFEMFYGQFIVIKIRVKTSEKYATDK